MDERKKRYFVRSGEVLSIHIVTDATHAVWSFLRKAFREDVVDKLGTFLGISRRGFEDENMLWGLTEWNLLVDEDKFVTVPYPRANMPRIVREPEPKYIDGRKLTRGPRKPPKDKHARYRQRCQAEGRCPRCGQTHHGQWVLCESCRAKRELRRKDMAEIRRTKAPTPNEIAVRAAAIRALRVDENGVICRDAHEALVESRKGEAEDSLDIPPPGGDSV